MLTPFEIGKLSFLFAHIVWFCAESLIMFSSFMQLGEENHFIERLAMLNWDSSKCFILLYGVLANALTSFDGRKNR